MAQDELERSGVPAADAAARSRRALGNSTLAREDARADLDRAIDRQHPAGCRLRHALAAQERRVLAGADPRFSARHRHDDSSLRPARCAHVQAAAGICSRAPRLPEGSVVLLPDLFRGASAQRLDIFGVLCLDTRDRKSRLGPGPRAERDPDGIRRLLLVAWRRRGDRADVHGRRRCAGRRSGRHGGGDQLRLLAAEIRWRQRRHRQNCANRSSHVHDCRSDAEGILRRGARPRAGDHDSTDNSSDCWQPRAGFDLMAAPHGPPP